VTLFVLVFSVIMDPCHALFLALYLPVQGFGFFLYSDATGVQASHAAT